MHNLRLFYAFLPVCYIVLQFLPMSARYLVGAGRNHEAMLILQQIARLNKTSLPEGELVQESQVGTKSLNLTKCDYCKLIHVVYLFLAKIYFYCILGLKSPSQFNYFN